MHPTDDVHERGALMAARACGSSPVEFARRALELAVHRAATAATFIEYQARIREAAKASDDIRRISASDAALARAIDAVPGVSVNAERIARYFAETDAVPVAN